MRNSFGISSSRLKLVKRAILYCSAHRQKRHSTHSFHHGYDDALEGNFNLILHPEHRIEGTDHIDQRTVPSGLHKPPYARSSQTYDQRGFPPEALYPLHSHEEQELRQAGKVAASALKYISALVRPGITTDALDAQLHQWIVDHDCYPSPLNYQGFPKSCCTSVNNIVAHGIPDSRPLERTDILTLDLTLYTRAGYHSDTSRTFCLDPPIQDTLATALEEITRYALYSAIKLCGPGVPFREIGRSIEHTVDRESSGMMSIVKQLTGHGIGTVFHMRPWILHYDNDEAGEMKPGHCFTIEPAVVASQDATTYTFLDNWTISTQNGSRAAQMEHTVLITEDGVDILTK